MTEHHEFEQTIDAAMDAIRVGDPDAAMHALADLAELGEPALRAAAMKLAHGGAELIGTMFSARNAEPMVELRLTDLDGQEVGIDDLEPTLRTAIRMVLSLVNGNEQDAADQLDVACEAGDHIGLASVVVQLLMWTEQLRGELQPSTW